MNSVIILSIISFVIFIGIFTYDKEKRILKLMNRKKRRGRPRKNPIFKEFNKDSKIRRLSHIVPLSGIPILYYLHTLNYSVNELLLTSSAIIIIYLITYASLDLKSLTDNKRANNFISPFILIGLITYQYFNMKIPLFSQDSYFYGAVGSSFLFVVIYLYSSEFYQPDLDHIKRPGEKHFPLGRTIAYWSFGRFLKKIFMPITIAWNKLWIPYMILFTHRGFFSHYPIISTITRTAYLYLIVFSINKTLYLFNLNIDIVESYLYAFFPWSKSFWSYHWFILCFPVYLTDLVHVFVDYTDSLKKGLPYCPERLPRGLVFKIYTSFKEKLAYWYEDFKDKTDKN